MSKKKTLAAKKSANNNSPKNVSKVNKKPISVKKKPEEVKQEKNERKKANIEANEKPTKERIETLTKALQSLGGISKEKLTKEDKVKTLETRKKLIEARKSLYENRRITSLKRRLAQGEKSEEEKKKSLDELKKEMLEQKRFDILTIFAVKDKPVVNTYLTESKIQATYIADTYFWIKNTDCHILEKLRGMPIKASIWPYKAVLKASKPIKESKPTTNTIEVKKAAKTKRKLINLNKFTLQHVRKNLRDQMKSNVQLKAA